MTKISQLPLVTVVIPHRENDVALATCLEAVRRQSYPSERVEVLVVLNEPENRDLSHLVSNGVAVLWEPEYFSYNARNLGVRSSRGDIIAFTDSDTIPHEDWLMRGVTTLTSTDASLVAGHIEVGAPRRPHYGPVLYERLYAFDQQKNVAGGFSTTANLFVKKGLFDSNGMFQETALSGEDFEWTSAAVFHGAHLLYEPESVVTHSARATWHELFSKARRTSIPFANRPSGKIRGYKGLRRRVVFQLGSKPSSSKRAALTPPQRALAMSVRLALIAYKAFCLVGLSPQFRSDLRRHRDTVSQTTPHPKMAVL